MSENEIFRGSHKGKSDSLVSGGSVYTEHLVARTFFSLRSAAHTCLFIQRTRVGSRAQGSRAQVLRRIILCAFSEKTLHPQAMPLLGVPSIPSVRHLILLTRAEPRRPLAVDRSCIRVPAIERRWALSRSTFFP